MKNTPLHVAASAGHLDVVKYLVEECKVSPFIRDKYVLIHKVKICVMWWGQAHIKIWKVDPIMQKIKITKRDTHYRNMVKSLL